PYVRSVTLDTLGTYARIGPYVRCRIALTPPDPDEASPQGEDKTPRRASGQTSVRGPQVPHRPPPLHQPRVRRPGPHPVTAPERRDALGHVRRGVVLLQRARRQRVHQDRKSTRLNSSHVK